MLVSKNIAIQTTELRTDMCFSEKCYFVCRNPSLAFPLHPMAKLNCRAKKKIEQRLLSPTDCIMINSYVIHFLLLNET